MVIFRKIVEKHKDSTKASGGLTKKKQQSTAVSEKLQKKESKQTKNAKLNSAEVTTNVKNAKLKKNLASLKKDATAETKDKTKILTSNKLRKKSVNESGKVSDSNSKKHGNSNILDIEKGVKVQKKNLKNEKSITQGSTAISARMLKRQHSSKKNAEKVNNKIPRKRRRIEVGESEETVDNLNLKDLSKKHILQCITAIFHLTQEQLKNKNTLFDGETHPVFMQVTCIRVPKVPSRQMKILLPHSIVSPNDEVALFVCDLEKGRRKDYEPTVEHYRDLLEQHGCTNVKTIIPMNQVKTEYDQHELKRKLVSSYDHFLVDGRIAGHMTHLLGREFSKRRKVPMSVRMQSKDLKHEIEHVLKKTSMHLHSFGDTHILQIGHTGMEQEEILENILQTCSQLSKTYPGGWGNIRSILIKTGSSLALPIYITLKNKNSVMVPLVKPRRPKAYHNVTDELSTASRNTVVTVTPEGDVTVERTTVPKKKEVMKKSDA